VSDIEFSRTFGEGICRECNVRSQPESKRTKELISPWGSSLEYVYASALEHHFMRPQGCPQNHEATCYVRPLTRKFRSHAGKWDWIEWLGLSCSFVGSPHSGKFSWKSQSRPRRPHFYNCLLQEFTPSIQESYRLHCSKIFNIP
jgi:hypothetical protein